MSNRCGLSHTSSLREKWSSQLTWELCCSLRDQRCYQHHDHEHVPHLALHYSYGRGICTVEERHACRLHTMPTRSSLPGTDCNSFRTRVPTVHRRLTHPTTTAAVGQSPLQVLLCFLARNQFPVGILATNPWHRQTFFTRSSVCACGSGGVGAVSGLITGSPLPTPNWRQLLKSIFEGTS